CEAFAMQVAELKTFCQQQEVLSEKMTGLLGRIQASLAANASADGEPAAGVDAENAASVAEA
ncbi:MAG: hypothetical protein IJI36_07660, partial [Kiritimatiellae bacterium]|nr:hypothetical protein [Kiritimatiellia bacterium]